jgi:hypothetical protein
VLWNIISKELGYHGADWNRIFDARDKSISTKFLSQMFRESVVYGRLMLKKVPRFSSRYGYFRNNSNMAGCSAF